MMNVVTNPTKSAATCAMPTLNHDRLAPALDSLFRLAAAVDGELRRADLVAWMHPARRESLTVLEHLGGLRHALDGLALGEGIASPYVLRLPTVAAPLAPQAPALDRGNRVPPPPFKVLGKGETDAGDDDCGASVVEGAPIGPSSASACVPCDPDPVPGQRSEVDAPHGPQTTAETVYPDTGI